MLFDVITAKAQYNLGSAEEYFREHLSVGDYYTESRHALGEWFGRGAKRLNLSGSVSQSDFVKLCHNTNPATGELLTQRFKEHRRIFYDFVLSPPKSVSIVALVGGDKRIEQAHHRAASMAMQELEKFAAARVRKDAGHGYRTTGNLVGAIFRHDTSRALDPHLHCHCIIFNATHDSTEARWKALETYEMLQASKYAENVYYHELARHLREFGYGLKNKPRGDFELEGISDELITTFSKRHREIDRKTAALLEQAPEKRNQNVKDIREHIAHRERAPKIKSFGRDQLRAIWHQQLSQTEKTRLSQMGHVREAQVPQSALITEAAITWAEQHLFDRRSVVNEYELWRHALEYNRGEKFTLKDLQLFTAQRAYIRHAKQPGKVTLAEVLEREEEIVRTAQKAQNQFESLSGGYKIKNNALDPEQRHAVEHILKSRDFITLFRGGAGTGKSFTLKEVRAGLLQARHPVLVIAPQRQQVIDLQRDMGCEGQTVSEFLTKRRMSEGAVVIVDEAGQIGAKQMLDLFRFVSQHHGRLILSGDTQQHGPVEASDALRAIEKFSGLNAAVLATVRRQNPKLGKTSQEQDSIHEYKLAVIEAGKGQLRASFERLNKNGAIIQCGLYEQQEFLTRHYIELVAQKCSTVIVAQTWSEIHKVNEQVRAGLKEENLIGKNDTTVTVLQRIDLTDAQKRDRRFYSEKSVMVFNRDTLGFRKGTQARLIDLTRTHLIVEGDGRIKPIAFKYLDRISVCELQEMALAAGDRLQLKANAKTKEGKQLANGELVTVKKIHSDGRIELEDRRMLERNYCQFVRGYAVTSYAAQGKTADYVIFSDSAIRAATDQKQWYVTISRGRRGIKIFTTDKSQLQENLIRSGNRELALELAQTSARLRFKVHSKKPIQSSGGQKI